MENIFLPVKFIKNAFTTENERKKVLPKECIGKQF